MPRRTWIINMKMPPFETGRRDSCLCGTVELPIILAGDLNSRRGSATMATFQKYFTVNCLSDGAPWTAPAPRPTYACDWLIYAPNDAFIVKAYNVCYWANEESDHYPVVATYVIK